MLLLYFFSKDAAQIGNVPQRPDDDIVEAIYKAMAFVIERRIVDPAIGNAATKQSAALNSCGSSQKWVVKPASKPIQFRPKKRYQNGKTAELPN